VENKNEFAELLICRITDLLNVEFNADRTTGSPSQNCGLCKLNRIGQYDLIWRAEAASSQGRTMMIYPSFPPSGEWFKTGSLNSLFPEIF